ncbi:MAG: sugar ABC transporter permease, partial [Christensenellaceae bacterium]|nr:sugar ABC transporter permease [Christensenellaceae bacterium]
MPPKTTRAGGLKQRLTPYLFLAPHLILFAAFFMIPAVVGILSAFTDWKLGQPMVWEGLANFKTLFFDQNSQYYWQLRWGLMNTIKFVLLTVPFQIALPLLLAVALHSKTAGHRVFQSIFYLPALLSIAVVMLSWNYMFNMSAGFINQFFRLGKLNWISSIPHNWIALIIITLWWVSGTNMVIYQSALAGIPQELYEAASVDGADRFRQFLHVTLPGMRYPLTYTAISSVVAQFGIFGQPLMFNLGGPVASVVNGFDNKSNNMLLM